MLRQSVFRDETKLDINYTPHKLPHRDRELDLLTRFFGFILHSPDKMTQRVLVTGNVGTGKTALCQRFGVAMTREAIKRGMVFRYVHVNCREYRGSLFLVLQHVISAFHPNFPRRGYSAEELLQVLMQMLDEENAHIILAMDEFDSLVEKEGAEAVYGLTRLQETRQGKPQRLSLICILRNLVVLSKLDASTRSTLQSNIINLEKYSKPQLIDIFNDRLTLAFRPSVVPGDTVSLIAELAAKENGNARFGIELLWRAGKYADAEGLDSVAPDCVRKAVSSVIPGMRRSDLISLNFHEKLFLLGIARFFREYQKGYVTLSEAEQAYAIVCEEFSTKPNSHTQLWKYLQDFAKTGIVEMEVSSKGSRGRSTLVYLPQTPAGQLEAELVTLLGRGDM